LLQKKGMYSHDGDYIACFCPMPVLLRLSASWRFPGRRAIGIWMARMHPPSNRCQWTSHSCLAYPANPNQDEGAGKVLAHARLLAKLAGLFQEIAPPHLGQASSVANYKSGIVVIHASRRRGDQATPDGANTGRRIFAAGAWSAPAFR
jgi:hypothetical protein